MMNRYLLLNLFSILTSFLTRTVAREAMINGKTARQSAFPYQVSVQVHGYGYLCGGGIIDDRFILTAARCVLNRNRQLLSSHISIHAGTKNYYKTDPPAVTVHVEKIFFPTEFEPTNKESSGDIAVLKVESLKLAQRPYLGKLQLLKNYNTKQKATVAGFGWQNFRVSGRKGLGSSNGQLRYANAYILTKDACKRAYPADTDAIKSETHLCARVIPFTITEPISTCTEDAGSPLVQNGNVIGILSRIPPNCDELFKPAVYTNVANYLKMISNAMQDKNDQQMISLYSFS